MNDSRRFDPRREACDELAARLGEDGGLRTARLLELAGLLSPPETPATASTTGWPRSIGVWQPQEVRGALVFVRPEPSPWGDHSAARREIPARKKPGTLRICWFGESAAAGYLYAPHATPARVLEHRLRCGGADCEVIDLARTNEGLESLVATLEAALQLVPDLLVIFTGNNWNLRETPELSPHFPSTTARQRLGQALRAGGVRTLVELAHRQLRRKAAAALARIARLAAGAGVPVALVVPEVNLGGWEHRQPPVWLAGDGNARWHGLCAEARTAPAWERVLELAEQMHALDAGLCPTTHRLRAQALAGLGRHEEACAAARDEVDAGAYPTLCALGSPQTTRVVQTLLRGAAAEHGWGLVDLPAVFAEQTGGASPGHRFFLDYCHLTLEGMEVAMTAVAEQVRHRLDLAGASPGTPFMVAPEVEATARLGAAIHGAHRLLAVGDKTAWLESWCRAALDASPGVAEAMRDLLTARTSPCPAVVSAAQPRNLDSPYRLSLQHGWRWAWLDADLLRAVARALGEPEPTALETLAATPEGIELTRPPYLWEPLERCYPEALELDGRSGRATFRAIWPQSSFALVTSAASALELTLTARLPPVPGIDVERRGTVVVAVDDAEIGRLEVGSSWRRHSLEIPAGALRPGLHRLSLSWPPAPACGEQALAAAARRLEDGLDAELHPILGEVFSLRARLCAKPAPG